MSTPTYQFSWFDWFCLWYPPAWLILFNRHWQHYKPDPNGWKWFEYGLFLLPGGFYLALLTRWLRLKLQWVLIRCGLLQPPLIINSASEEPDPVYQQAFRDEILTPIVKRYFRAELHQADQLPNAAPVIITINHAGMCFPWDCVCLGLLLSEQRDWFIQPLAHPIFFDHPWLKWWLPTGWTQVLGGVRAEQESFEAAIAERVVLLYAPEGWRGLTKGWQQRYRLARFDSSFVRSSVRDRIPILPVVCIGSESLHPFAVNVKWLARWFKMPMFPLSPLIPIFALFPSMGIWAMRVRLQYHHSAALVSLGGDPNAAGTPRQTVLHRLARELRSRLQVTINHLRNEN
ncbi:MAG: glycerol acyltransferase [Leptolyngbyaceae cyanobacterium RU_5_1]|nr:glycerol acyltransferase [Leptolyngbyaceae cyanobacterium RU_5_1]